MDANDFLTVQQAAAEWGLAETIIRNALLQGRLPFTRRFGRKLIARADLDTYKARTQPEGVKRIGRPKSVATETNRQEKAHIA